MMEERIAAETRKFIAEHEKLAAEREKSFQQALKFESERTWHVTLALLFGNAALAAIIGAVVALLMR